MRVLIVDDEYLTCNFLKVKIPTLRSSCEIVGTAQNGEEALCILGQTQVDLLITDIKMPVMDGIELCRRVSQSYPSVLTAILSGYDDFPLAQEAIRNGVQEYLLKPIVNTELEKVLERLEHLWRKRESQTNLKSATDSWLRSQYLQAIALQWDTEAAACQELMGAEDLQRLEHPFWLLLFSAIYPENGTAAAQTFSLSRMEQELFHRALAMEQKLPDGELFSDGYGNAVLFLPRQADPAEPIFRLEKDGGPAFGAVLVSGDGLSSLPSCRQLAENLLLYPHLVKNERYFMPQVMGNKPPFIPVTESAQRILENARHILYSCGSIVQSGDPLELTRQIQRLYELMTRQANFIPSGELLWKLGVLLYRFIARQPSCSSPPEFLFLLGQVAAKNACSEKLPPEFLKLYTDLCRKTASPPLEHHLVGRCKEYILLHFSEPLSLAMLAEEVGVSENYLSSIFHRETGESYIKYLTRVRMEEAARLLRESPRLRLEEISIKTGYANSKHLLSVFKKYFGITPGEYRARYTAKIDKE